MSEPLNLFELITAVENWAIERGLDKGDPKLQMIKLVEEIGELSRSIIRNDEKGIIDSIGDSVVVLIILAMQNGLILEECLQAAYDEIKDRKGKMVNGVFIKESDFKGLKVA